MLNIYSQTYSAYISEYDWIIDCTRINFAGSASWIFCFLFDNLCLLQLSLTWSVFPINLHRLSWDCLISQLVDTCDVKPGFCSGLWLHNSCDGSTPWWKCCMINLTDLYRYVIVTTVLRIRRAFGKFQYTHISVCLSISNTLHINSTLAK